MSKIDLQHSLYSIQQLSIKLDIPKSTLRFWEKEFEGILLPLRTNGGQRRYSSEHISVVDKIKRLKEGGLSLAEIKRKLGNKSDSHNSDSEGIDLLARRVAEVVRYEVVKFFKEGE